MPNIMSRCFRLASNTDELKLLNPSPKELQHDHLNMSFMKMALNDFYDNTVGKITGQLDLK